MALMMKILAYELEFVWAAYIWWNKHGSTRCIYPRPEHGGSLNVNLKVKDYPSSANIVDRNYTVTTATTDRVATEINGRYWQYILSGNTVDQDIELGQWYQEVKRSSPK